MSGVLYVLGVDPGRRSGAGLVRCVLAAEPVTTCVGSWQHTRARDTPEAFAEATLRAARAVATADTDDPRPLRLHLVHEAQYSPPPDPDAPAESIGVAQGTLKTATVAGVWRGLAAHYGYRVVDDGSRYGVHPQTWRAELDDRPKGQRTRRTGRQWERWAVEKVRAHGIDCLKTHHHRAEAILIGVWGARRLAELSAKGGA